MNVDGATGWSWLDVARAVFPDADDAARDSYLWEYTSFPYFDEDDPGAQCSRQLHEAKAALARGDWFDLERGWVPSSEGKA